MNTLDIVSKPSCTLIEAETKMGMRELRDLQRTTLMLLLVLAFGTVGYAVIERWSLVDSTYTTKYPYFFEYTEL